jgi:hypothetical protein
MGLTITSKLIRSSASSHTAELEGQALADAWSVSWLPGRVLTGRQAVAAMELADAVGQIPADCDPEVYDDKFWDRVDSWSAELALPGPTAVMWASEPPASDREEG